MRVAVVSDIHGNRQAFEAVLADIGREGADEMWCLGDLVGYGADPDACVQLAAQHAAICLAGNHDLAVTGELSVEEFSRGGEVAAGGRAGRGWGAAGGGGCLPPHEKTLAFLEALEPFGHAEGVGLYHA